MSCFMKIGLTKFAVLNTNTLISHFQWSLSGFYLNNLPIWCRLLFLAIIVVIVACLGQALARAFLDLLHVVNILVTHPVIN
jgi:hypothetical protein